MRWDDAAVLGRWLPTIAWTGLLAAVLLLMAAAGDGALAAPPWQQPDRWAAWATERGGAAAALAVVRVTVMAVAAWLLAVTAASLAMALGRPATAVELAALLGTPIVARVLQGALGVGLAGATVAAAAGLGAGGGSTSRIAGPPTLEVVGSAAGGSAPPPTTQVPPVDPTPASPPSPPSAQEPEEQLAPARAAWIVGAGDHLWSIAEVVVGGSDGAPRDAEVARYWRALLEANRDRLADPANPDLLFAGQELSLPPVDGPAVRSRR